MTKVVPYLSVSNAVKAVDLYNKIFDITDFNRMEVAAEQAVDFGLSDDADLSKTTIHGELKIEGEQFYISDNFTGAVLDKQSVSILFEFDSLDRAQQVFARAKEQGCTITMEFAKQYWGDYFGAFTDPFGVAWQLNFDTSEQ